MQKIATLISALFSPMLLIPSYAIYAAATNLTGTAATLSIWVSVAICGSLSLYFLWLVRTGRLSNADASVKSERQKRVYPAIIGVLSSCYGLFYYLNQPTICLKSTFFLLLLFLIGYVINFFIKASLHTATPLLLASMLLPISPALSLFLFAATPFIAWSRYELKRHTIPELIVGFVMGLTIGGLYISW